MKHLIFLFTFMAFTLSYSQESKSEKETSGDTEVAFAIIENVPIYKGCDENMPNSELKKCMNSQINHLIATNFNTNIAKKIGLPNGVQKISVLFKINPEGKIIDIKARATHPALQEEAIRVVNLIPKMDKPGFQKGKAVTVPYYLPIKFMVDNKKKRKRK